MNYKLFGIACLIELVIIAILFLLSVIYDYFNPYFVCDYTINEPLLLIINLTWFAFVLYHMLQMLPQPHGRILID